MFPEEIVSTICLVIIFTVNTVKRVDTRFSFLCFKPGRVCSEICLAIPCYIPMIFKFVWTIIFLILKSIWMICKCYMLPLSAVFILRDVQIYIRSSYNSDMSIYIGAVVNKTLCSYTGLWILLKIWVLLTTVSMISGVIGRLVLSTRYEILRILR